MTRLGRSTAASPTLVRAPLATALVIPVGIATASASALTPIVVASVAPTAASATAAGLLPTLRLTLLPTAATATAQALVVTIASVPVVIQAPVATATAAALSPAVVRGAFVGPVSGPIHVPRRRGQRGQYWG